jgi:hypothetical protein
MARSHELRAKPNTDREILVCLVLLRGVATGLGFGVSVKKPGVKPLDCVFVSGLDEYLIRIHSPYCMPPVPSALFAPGLELTRPVALCTPGSI